MSIAVGLLSAFASLSPANADGLLLFRDGGAWPSRAPQTLDPSSGAVGCPFLSVLSGVGSEEMGFSLLSMPPGDAPARFAMLTRASELRDTIVALELATRRSSTMFSPDTPDRRLTENDDVTLLLPSISEDGPFMALVDSYDTSAWQVNTTRGLYGTLVQRRIALFDARTGSFEWRDFPVPLWSAAANGITYSRVVVYDSLRARLFLAGARQPADLRLSRVVDDQLGIWDLESMRMTGTVRLGVPAERSWLSRSGAIDTMSPLEGPSLSATGGVILAAQADHLGSIAVVDPASDPPSAGRYAVSRRVQRRLRALVQRSGASIQGMSILSRPDGREDVALIVGSRLLMLRSTHRGVLDRLEEPRVPAILNDVAVPPGHQMVASGGSIFYLTNEPRVPPDPRLHTPTGTAGAITTRVVEISSSTGAATQAPSPFTTTAPMELIGVVPASASQNCVGAG